MLMENWAKRTRVHQFKRAQVNQNYLSAPATIYVKDQGITKIILLSDVIMMQADSNYTTIHLANGSRIFTSKTLKYWIQKIGDNNDFIRPHRSFVVNKKYVVAYQANPRSISISGDIAIPVSNNFDINNFIHK